MSGRMQELTIVFDREQQTFMYYLGVPWEPLGDEIRAAQRAVEAAGAAQGLRLDGPDEIRRPVAAPHAVLFFQWGYPGRIATFLSEESLTWSEQTIVAEALAVARGWSIGEWWQGNHRLLVLANDAPRPYSVYAGLSAVSCPARHPASVLAAGHCDHCAEAVKRIGVWPTRCAECGSDRDRALQLLEQQGYVCPICQPDALLGRQKRDTHRKHRGPPVYERHEGFCHPHWGVAARPPGLLRGTCAKEVSYLLNDCLQPHKLPPGRFEGEKERSHEHAERKRSSGSRFFSSSP